MIFNYFRVPGAHFGDPGDFVYVIHYVILFAIFFYFFNAGHHLFALFCFVFLSSLPLLGVLGIWGP